MLSSAPAPRRRRVAAQDTATIAAIRDRGKRVSYPFSVETDDHCETSPQAFEDIAPLLTVLAKQLGKAKGDLRIYDPYYCAGSTKMHLGKLGFTSVYNECEDFYARVASGSLPEHDVVVTNPPYSGDHVRRLLRFVRKNKKPFLLLLPAYCAESSAWRAWTQKSSRIADNLCMLCPRSRYQYWTPHGLRPGANPKAHANIYLGSRSSPFPSYWHVCAMPVMGRPALREWWARQGAELSEDDELWLFDSAAQMKEAGWGQV